MEKIASFCINHDHLMPGLYVSRQDGDVITYDLRMIKPNQGAYLEDDGLHSFEHLLASYVRNSKYRDAIIYVGVMGCRTGFYLLARDFVSKAEILNLVQDSCSAIAAHEGEIPGAAASAECGNYRCHDLNKAKAYAVSYGKVLASWNEAKMKYPLEVRENDEV